MTGCDMTERELMELDESFIVLAVPSDAVEVEISAKIYKDGQLHKVAKTMGFKELREAMKEAEDGYIPSDAVFTIAPVGEAKLEELLRKQMAEYLEDYKDQ